MILLAAILIYRLKKPPLDLRKIPDAEYIEANTLKAQIENKKKQGACFNYPSPHLVITPNGHLLGCRVADDLVVCLPEPDILLNAEDCNLLASKHGYSILHEKEYKRLISKVKEIKDCFNSVGITLADSYWFCANIYSSRQDEYADINWLSGQKRFYEHSFSFQSWKSGFICQFG